MGKNKIEENERKLAKWEVEELNASSEVWKAINHLCNVKLAIALQKKILEDLKRKDNEHSASN